MTLLDPQEQLVRWNDAALAAACLLVDGHGLGGVHLRGRPGPVRDLWLEEFRALLDGHTSLRKIPCHCAPSRLLGGLDLAATLRSGRPVGEAGLLAESHGGVVLLSMAERAEPAITAPIAAVLDDPVLRIEREGVAATYPCEIAVLAFDEGVDDERMAPSLRERLALSVDITSLALAAVDEFPFDSAALAVARTRLVDTQLSDEELERLCAASIALGIDSPRVTLLAARLARVLMALDDVTTLEDELFQQVLRLCLVPRATRLPQPAADDPAATEEPTESPSNAPEEAADAPPPPSRNESDLPDDNDRSQQSPGEEERLLEAAKAVLPAELLAQLVSGARRSRRAAPAGKSGAVQRHKLRGRPIGSVAGDPRRGERIDVLATLRAAAPWQKLRDAASGGARVRVQPEDFRVVRFQQHAQSVTLFVVDASGSAALYRLAEAKGAVELLLADCYVRRDEVALIAFRGDGAEVLLPPTRSLVRAKRSLSALPGGGGTPLAAAIDMTADLLETLERRGATPAYVMLTDGRANVCRDGSTGREVATDDALAAAQVLRQRVASPGMVIDTSPRPHRSADRLASALGAHYQPLPNADAAQLRAVVGRVGQ